MEGIWNFVKENAGMIENFVVIGGLMLSLSAAAACLMPPRAESTEEKKDAEGSAEERT